MRIEYQVFEESSLRTLADLINRHFSFLDTRPQTRVVYVEKTEKPSRYYTEEVVYVALVEVTYAEPAVKKNGDSN